ncbi:4Fe-4S dicluster domain-containing protein [Desulforamulus aquiferis]|uniref:4Fe-4S dicluster domain-containing protein n=1 Tax=Desulforamulus aquiferis TaxID=1397668 RepID=A0AAW7ZFN0_9FIRM|nr:4Fe-4S dicluster domain-containing protein [Desulforamulus aquiferis]MDO7787590.1 4Fe-4S dicluster domain-containing protein [Desulforamulus aquiferis]
MKKKVLVTYPERCLGCRICEQWCAYRHHGKVDPVRSRIKLAKSLTDYLNIPVVCQQCPNSPCIASCKFGALSKDPLTGAIAVDEEKCVGCRRCMRSCPHAAIALDKEKRVVIICDLCQGNPQCVAQCPAGAIDYLPLEITDRAIREEAVRKCLCRKGVKDNE